MDDMDAVYRQHARTVYKFLLSQCRDPLTAEELTQETFYQAVRAIHRFDGSCKVSVWLCQIAKHLWYMKYIATRPRAERLGSHGLFGDKDGVELDKAMAELENYTGNV